MSGGPTRAKLLEVLGGDRTAGARRPLRLLPDDADLVITTGWPATAPLLRQAADRRAADLERGRAGLAAQPARTRSCPWLGITGHQRQDHHHPDAGVDPCARPGCGRRRSATSAGRSWRSCSTPSRTTCSPSSCPAISCTGRTRWPCIRRQCSTCNPTTSSGTARTRLPRRQGQDLRTVSRPAASTTSLTHHRADGRGGRGRRGCPSDRLHPGHTRLSRCSASLTICWSIGPSSHNVRTRRWSSPRSATSLRLHRTTWPTHWPPQRWRARTACRGRRCGTDCDRSEWAPQDPDCLGTRRNLLGR